ncbi:cyclase [Actinomadura craniellae]|uniref:Cyclase n=1 Tax=Actinomadura craniellae TaxID=2231787 RepID=A0A365H4L5_9ACTN|nr:SRPBCC family protein [Actinomadura craniellae]RAY14045.1 cyclase [Actinomadura craniellae]
MSTIEQSIDINVPVRPAYDQWTQFEEFPRFMEGVDRIEQVTDTRTHWVTSIAGVRREFDAEITEQRPDERIAWRSIEEPRQAGVVTFHRLGPDQTRVMLQMEFAPQGLAEQAGDKLHLVERRVKGDLKRFKEFIEERGAQTGAWRGEVPQDPTR